MNRLTSLSARGLAGLAAAMTGFACLAAAAAEYHPSDQTMADRTIALTGHDLTVDQVVAVARHGAKVALTPAAEQHSADLYGLLLEGATEGVSIYRFNRGAGEQREIVTFTGDPLSDENRPKLAARALATFENGPNNGFGPEVADEDIVRATMVVRANAATFAAISPPVTAMLIDLLNAGITPVVQSQGSVSEGDLQQMHNIAGAMVGKGDVHYHGVRMSAAAALAQAGLRPVAPFGADDDAIDATNAFTTGQAALLVADGKNALDWADLIDAMDLNGMNSSITPLGRPVQDARPFQWLNWDAARLLDMIRGSYLFELDPARIIQDPESLRASSIRQGSAWKAWAALAETVTIQMNASDNNPAVAELSPGDSWELATPQFMRYYVKGGPASHGQHGYIVSNANWDPYPLANDIEAFTNALANLDVAVAQRIQRFGSRFFTGIDAISVVPPERLAGGSFNGSAWLLPASLWLEIQNLAHPFPAAGFVSDTEGVGDLESEAAMKAKLARDLVDDTLKLLGQDLLTASAWMDVRKFQDPRRAFGAAPTAAWTAFRKVVPLQNPAGVVPDRPVGEAAYEFLRGTPAAAFYTGGPAMPKGDQPAP
jgi:histidine ammonia-lyase